MIRTGIGVNVEPVGTGATFFSTFSLAAYSFTQTGSEDAAPDLTSKVRSSRLRTMAANDEGSSAVTLNLTRWQRISVASMAR